MTLYEGEAEAKPSNYILIYVGGEVGADKNRGDEGSSGGGGSVSVIVSIRLLYCLTVTPVHVFNSFSQTSTRQTTSMHKAEREIVYQRKNLTRYMIQGKLMASRADPEA